jgi:hypothetical protein
MRNVYPFRAQGTTEVVQIRGFAVPPFGHGGLRTPGHAELRLFGLRKFMREPA